jgi:hypothetical protein
VLREFSGRWKASIEAITGEVTRQFAETSCAREVLQVGGGWPTGCCSLCCGTGMEQGRGLWQVRAMLCKQQTLGTHCLSPACLGTDSHSVLMHAHALCADQGAQDAPICLHAVWHDCLLTF